MDKKECEATQIVVEENPFCSFDDGGANNCYYQHHKNTVAVNKYADLLNTLDKLYRHISDAIMFGRYSTDKDKQTLKEYATALMNVRSILIHSKGE